jgi:nitroreductase/dihydropteridine reductase
MAFTDHLTWRHAVRSFDPARPASSEKVEQILNAIRMTPTSYGLQPFRVYIVTNQTTKEKLFSSAAKQAQVRDCSHLLVFAARTDLLAVTDEYLHELSQGDQTKRLELVPLETAMRAFMSGLGILGAKKIWASKQTYLALGFALAAAAEHEVASSPMEGFEPKGVQKILRMPRSEHPVVLLALGEEMEGVTIRPKVRKSREILFRSI